MESHTATLPYSSEKPNNPIIHSTPSYSRFRSLSHNDQRQCKCESPKALSASVSQRICQSPPKLVFGQPIVAASFPPECTGASSLSNSLLVEYLALVSQPFLSLMIRNMRKSVIDINSIICSVLIYRGI